MEAEQLSPINTFHFEGKDLPVSFVETMNVTNGVTCDSYNFDGDPGKDLGIIRIMPGKKTPLQRVLKGDRTVEGYVSGKGNLRITKPDGKIETYEAGVGPLAVDVKIGELMQWEADPDSKLVAYEVCMPRYEAGRYKNIE